MSFASNLVNCRADGKLTQTQLANAIGVSTVTISAWERGQAGINAGQLEKLADFFNVTMDYLIDRNMPECDPMDKDVIAFQRAYKRASAEKRENIMTLLKIAFPSDFAEC